MDNIPILYNILPSLLPILPRRLNRRHTLRALAQIAKIMVRNDLGFYKAPFEIRVDGACGLWCKATLGDRPAADLLLAGGEVVLEAELGEAWFERQ